MPFDFSAVDLDIEEEDDQEKDLVQSNFSEAVKVNADQHAEQLQLSKETDVPTFAVDETTKQKFNFDAVDFDDVTKNSPKTTQFLSNFDNSVVAQDDIDVLQSIEDVFDFSNTFKNLGKTAEISFELQGKGMLAVGVDATPERIEDLIPFDMLPPGAMISPQEAQIMSADFAKNFGIETDEQLVQAKEEGVNKIVTEIRTLQEESAELSPEDLNLLEQGVRGGVDSLINMAPGMGLMLLSGGRAAPLLATMGVQTFGSSYADARAEGLEPDKAAWFAGINSVIEVGTEMLPTGTLERIITGKSTGMKKEALKFLVQEMGTEQLATLGQSMNEFAFGLDEQMSDPNISITDKIAIQARRQAVTAIATVVAGGAQITAATGLRKGVNALTRDAQVKQTQGDIEQQKIDTLNTEAEKSKLRERDKESFRQFVQEADGDNNTNVFIDSAQTSLYLQSKTPDEIAADPALTALSEQVAEASTLGTDIQIPVAEFATDFAGTEHFEALRDSMTMSDETVTPFRQEQVKQEQEAYVARLMEEAGQNASEYVQAQEIFTQVHDQLVDTGTVTPANASIMAQIVPAWATAQATRTGKTVEQVYQDAGLIIEGPQTGERARQADEIILSQEPAYREAPIIFDSVRDEFLEVLPEDATVEDVNDAISEFEPEYKNFIKALERADWLGFDFPSQAISAVLSEEIDNFDVPKGLKQSIGKMVNTAFGVATVEQRATLLEQREVPEDEATRQQLERDRGQAVVDEADVAQQKTIEETQTRNDREALAEFNRAKSGEAVTFNHRSFADFTEFDDTHLDDVDPTRTPSAHLGHYLSADDVSNVDRYGDIASVYQFTLENPLVISAEAFESATDGLTHEESIAKRQAFIEMGHDGILVEGLNWAIVFESKSLTKLEEDLGEAEIPFEQEQLAPTEHPVISQVEIQQAINKGLDMSEEARIQRAEEMGFDTSRVVYHGSSREGYVDDTDIRAFDPEKVGDKWSADEAGYFFTTSQKFASDYALSDRDRREVGEGQGVVYPVYLKMNNPLIIDDTFLKSEGMSPIGETEDSISFWDNFQSLIFEWVEEGGHDSVILRDNTFKSEDGKPTETRVVFNPSQIRSVNAAFDPSFKESADLLAQKTDGKKPTARGYYDPANTVIRLTEAADLSTFLHEFAHFMYEMEVSGNTDMLQSINNWYKRNAEDVAEEANSYLGKDFDGEKQGEQPTVKPGSITPEDVVAFLDDDTTGNAHKDVAIRRAVHEQFARGFETYLMEGKTPSIELRNAFRTFARWLSRIYQAMRSKLNVNLDAEMRAVFDRLVATEDQIAAAEARAQVEPMFTDAAMAGMTEKQFNDYQQRQGKVKDVQSETLRDKLIKQLTRQTEKWWKEEKSDIVDDEIDNLKTERVYAAREQLKSGDLKLDHATVKEMAGEEKTNKLGRTSVVIPPELTGMTAKGQKGVHPDEAAAFLGYNSGSEMINDLVTAPAIKIQAETNAEAAMIERHGDIFTDGTIEREADEAVQNEERGKLILAELKALAKGTNAPTIDRATIKAVAATNIGKLAFREIHPDKYRKAEIRAAQESATMLAEGNKEGAAEAKMRQVMNYYLGMEATKAKNETMKIVDRMSRYNKKKVRQEIMKAENEYMEQIDKILSRFEFRKVASLKSVENINLWAKERMEADGDGLVLTAEVLNEAYVTHWKNIPFSDLQGVNDSVKNIEHVARYANKIKLQQDEIDFNKLKGQWVDHINEQDQRFETKESRSRIDDSRKATTMEHIRKWASQLTKVPYLASWLDGGERAGMSHGVLVQPFTDALDVKMKMVDEVALPVIEAIRNRSKADQKRHMTKIWIPEIEDHLLGHQVLAVALNAGNHGNMKKMLLGEGWADPEIDTDISINNPKLQAVLKHMTQTDWALVQRIWNQMNLLYPQLAEVHRRTTGLTPPKVEAVPIETEFGTFEGGYYPVKYSPKRSHKAEKNAEKREAETESMFNNTASIQASVNTGTTNERTGFYDRVYLSLEVIPDHFNETIHYITHHDAVRQVNRLIQAPDVANAITGVLGEEEFKQLKPWLNDVAKDGRQQPVKTYIDTIFQRLRFGTTLGIMGFKASTGIMQVYGLLTTAAELGTGPTIKGIYTTIGRSWYMKAVRNILGSTDDMQTGWEFASEKSKVMNHRAQTMDREIRNAMGLIQGERGIMAAVQEASMKHIMLIQTYIVDLPTWHAAYSKELSESGDESKAVNHADWAVENLQGSGATKDMATILRNQSKLLTTMTMFMTFFSSLGNLSRDLVKGSRSGLYSNTTVAAKLMFLFTLPVFFEMLMRGELADEDEDATYAESIERFLTDPEDERMNKFLTNVALYPLTSIPFVRDAASGLIGDYGYNNSPVASVIEKGIQGYKQIGERALTDEEITKSAKKNASKLTGVMLAVPGVSQAWSTGEHLYDVVEEGEEFTVREFLFGPKRE